MFSPKIYQIFHINRNSWIIQHTWCPSTTKKREKYPLPLGHKTNNLICKDYEFIINTVFCIVNKNLAWESYKTTDLRTLLMNLYVKLVTLYIQCLQKGLCLKTSSLYIWQIMLDIWVEIKWLWQHFWTNNLRQTL